MKIKITCGTLLPEEIEIDTDEFGIRNGDARFGEHEDEALKLLKSTMDDLTFMADGCRNDDAVNSMVALHALGYDAGEWMSAFCDWLRAPKHMTMFHLMDIDAFQEHVERVKPYVVGWGPYGNEAEALGYAIG